MSAGKNDPATAKNHVFLRHNGDDLAHVRRRRHRERGDGAAVGYAEQHPAVEERRQDRRTLRADKHIVRRSRETSNPVRQKQSRRTAKSRRPAPTPAETAQDAATGPAMSLAVRKIEDPMMPLTSSSTESSSESPRTSVGCGFRGLGSVPRQAVERPIFIRSPVHRAIPAECHNAGRSPRSSRRRSADRSLPGAMRAVKRFGVGSGCGLGHEEGNVAHVSPS